MWDTVGEEDTLDVSKIDDASNVPSAIHDPAIVAVPTDTVQEQWKQRMRDRGQEVQIDPSVENRFDVAIRQGGFSARFGNITPDWSHDPVLHTSQNVRGMDDFAWINTNNFTANNSFDAQLSLPDSYDTVYRCTGDRDDPDCTAISEYETGMNRPYYKVEDGRTVIFSDQFSGGGGSVATADGTFPWNEAYVPGKMIEFKETEVFFGENGTTTLNVSVNNYGFGTWDLNVSLWAHQTTDLSHNSQEVFTDTGEIRSVVTGDITQDGNTEIVVGGWTGDVYVLEYNGGSWDETLVGSHTIDDAGVNRLSLVDVTGNGVLDIVSTAAGWDGSDAGDAEIRLFTNTETTYGDESHEIGHISGSNEGFWAGKVADLTGDGNIEVVGAGSDNKVYLFEQDTGYDDWTQQEIYESEDTRNTIDFADFTGDGQLDIIIGGNQQATFQDDDVLELLTRENGQWQRAALIDQTNDDVMTAVAADLYQDGQIDIVAGTRWDNSGEPALIRYWDVGDGWAEGDVGIEVIDTAEQINNIQILDYDGDGRHDIIAVAGDDYGKLLFFNNTNNTAAGFVKETIYVQAQNERMEGLTVADINGNGVIDIVTGDHSGEVVIHENTGMTATLLNWTELTFTESDEEKQVTLNWETTLDEFTLVASVDMDQQTSDLYRTQDQGSLHLNRVTRTLSPVWLNATVVDEEEGVFVDAVITVKHRTQPPESVTLSAEEERFSTKTTVDEPYNVSLYVPVDGSFAEIVFQEIIAQPGREIDPQVVEDGADLPGGVVPGKPLIALDDTDLEFVAANLTFPKGGIEPNRIFRCPDWDRESAECTGSWEGDPLEEYDAEENATHIRFAVEAFSAYTVGEELLEEEVRFMTSNEHTVHAVTSDNLSIEQSDSMQEVEENFGGGQVDVDWGVQVFLLHDDGSKTGVISSPSAVVTRTGSGSGMQDGTLEMPETGIAEQDAVFINVSIRFDEDLWEEVATFVTKPLGAELLSGETWTVHYHTERDSGPQGGGFTDAWFRWGAESHNSRIEGFTYVPVQDVEPWLEVDLVLPDEAVTVDVGGTFTVNATATCRDGSCGEVTGEARYNESGNAPDTAIPQFSGEPFHTTEKENPLVCADPLPEDETCFVSWTVNASGDAGIYAMDVMFSSDEGGVEDAVTEDELVTIEEDEPLPPPAITIHHPLNATLSVDEPWLNVTADTDVDTWKYDLNAAGNETFSPNITLESLEDGRHNVTVWANSSDGGAWGSEIRWFTTDVTPPLWRNLKDNSTGEVDAGKTVNISAEFRDELGGLERVVLATNETGEWVNHTDGTYGSPRFYSGVDQYYWTAEDYEVGEVPEAWEPEANIESYEIAEDGEGNKFLNITGTIDARSNLRFTPSGESEDTEVWVRWFTDDADHDAWAFSRGTALDDPDNLDAVRVDWVPVHDEDRLAEFVDGTYNNLVDQPITVQPGNMLQMRGSFEGDTLQGKWWADGGSEPEDWDLEAETAVVGEGHTGIGHWEGGSFRVYEFGVGVNGREAPTSQPPGAPVDEWKLAEFMWKNTSFSGELGYRLWGKDEAGNWNGTDTGTFAVAEEADVFDRQVTVTVVYTELPERTASVFASVTGTITYSSSLDRSSWLFRVFTASASYAVDVVRTGTSFRDAAVSIGYDSVDAVHQELSRAQDAVFGVDIGATGERVFNRITEMGAVYTVTEDRVTVLERTVFVDIDHDAVISTLQVVDRLVATGAAVDVSVDRVFEGVRVTAQDVGYASVETFSTTITRLVETGVTYADSVSRTVGVARDGVVVVDTAVTSTVDRFVARSVVVTAGYDATVDRALDNVRTVASGFDVSVAGTAALVQGRFVEVAVSHVGVVERQLEGFREVSGMYGYDVSAAAVAGYERVAGLFVGYGVVVERLVTLERLQETGVDSVYGVERAYDGVRSVVFGVSVVSVVDVGSVLERSVSASVDVTGVVGRGVDSFRSLSSGVVYSFEASFTTLEQRIVEVVVSFGGVVERQVVGVRDVVYDVSYGSVELVSVARDRVLAVVVGYDTVLDRESLIGRFSEVAVDVSGQVDRGVNGFRDVVTVAVFDKGVERRIGTFRAVTTAVDYGVVVERFVTLERLQETGVDSVYGVERAYDGVRSVVFGVPVVSVVDVGSVLERSVSASVDVTGVVGRGVDSFRSIVVDVSHTVTASFDLERVRVVELTVQYTNEISRQVTVFRSLATDLGVSVVESVSIGENRIVVLTVEYGESLSRQFTGVRDAVFSAGVDTTVTVQAAYERLVSAVPVYAVDVDRVGVVTRLVDGTVLYEPEVTKSANLQRVMDSVYILAGAVDRTGLMSRQVADLYRFMDSTTEQSALTRMVEESYEYAVTLQHATGFQKIVADAFTVTVDTTRGFIGSRTVFQVLEYGDEAWFDEVAHHIIEYSFAVGTEVSRTFVGERFFTAVFAAGEEVSVFQGFSRTVNEMFNVETVHDRAVNGIRGAATVVTYTATFDATTVLDRVIGETVRFETQETREVSATRLVQSPVLAATEFTAHQVLARTIQASMVFMESIQSEEGSFRTIISVFAVDDASVTGFIGNRVITGNIVFDASSDATAFITRSVQDTVEFTGEVVRTATVSRLVASGYSLEAVESVERRVVITVFETIDYTGAATRTVAFTRLLERPVGVLEAVSRQVEMTRVLGEVFTFSAFIDWWDPADEPEPEPDRDHTPSTAIHVEPKPSLMIETKEIIIKIEPGGRTNVAAQFANNGTAQGEYVVEVASLADYFSPSQTAYFASEGQSVSARFTVEVPEEKEPGVYNGSVVIRGETMTGGIPVTMIVTSPEPEDVDFRLDMLEHELFAGDDGQYLLNLYNLGRNRTVPVNMTIDVLDEEGNIMRTIEESHAVETALSLRKRLAGDLPPGNYTLRAVARYANEIREDHASFMVRERVEPDPIIPLPVRYIIGIITVLAVVAGAGILTYRRRLHEQIIERIGDLYGADEEQGVQPPSRVYRCRRCGKTFDSRTVYQVHENRHWLEDQIEQTSKRTAEKARAGREAVRFGSQQQEKKEVSRQPVRTVGEYRCSRCGKAFRARELLHIHRNVRH